MGFKIGDRVFEKEHDFAGIVTDVMYSHRAGDYVYEVSADENSSPFGCFKYEDLEFVPDPIPEHEYHLSAEIDEESKIVYCILKEYDGSRLEEIAHGRGYIKHDGVVGLAQAFSYAAKMVLKAVDKDGIYYKK